MLDRRRFLTSSLALTAAVSGCATPTRRRIAPGEKLNLGFIGVANRAAANLAGCTHENVVALCDVDARNLAKAAEQFPNAKRYSDYQDMLGQIRRADELGYDNVWLTEHHFCADGHAPSILPLAAAVAAMTKTIRIGTGVMLLPGVEDPAEDGETTEEDGDASEEGPPEEGASEATSESSDPA